MLGKLEIHDSDGVVSEMRSQLDRDTLATIMASPLWVVINRVAVNSDLLDESITLLEAIKLKSLGKLFKILIFPSFNTTSINNVGNLVGVHFRKLFLALFIKDLKG